MTRQDAMREQRPLRILCLLMRYGGGESGGQQEYAFQLGRLLAQRGHEFHLLACSANPGAPVDDYRDGPIHVHRRAAAEPGVLDAIADLPMTHYRLRQAFSHWQEHERLGLAFDVVESPDWGACGLLIAQQNWQPVVSRLHGPLALEVPFYGETDEVDVRVSDRLERALASRATLVTAVTHRIGAQLRASGWLERDDVRVVRNPTDFASWATAGPVQETGPVVLFAGRLEARKAPELLVRAVARLKETVPGVCALFVGRSNGKFDGKPYRDGLESLAGQLGAPCQFLGEVAREKLPDIYGQARVVAVPSWMESFSLVGLEALACGRPVVCTSEVGLVELIGGSPASTVVPPGDAESLAAGLEPYLLSADHAAAAGERGRQLAISECALETVADQAEACYREAVDIWNG